MSGLLSFVPDGYAVLTKREISDYACEYIASRKADNTLVRLKVYGFSGTVDSTKSRHLRNYLRRDVGFMDELDHPNIIRLFDYSETKKHFWIATQPAKIERLGESLSRIKDIHLEKRKEMVRQLLSTIEHIHSCKIVHQNLSGDAVFLGTASELYIGDFGLASYLSDEHTSVHDTDLSMTSGVTYLAPEIKNAQTATPDTRCDIFSASLLAIEVLLARAVPKDIHGDLHGILRKHFEGIIEITNTATCDVLVKAIDPDPQKRWPGIKDFSFALEMALQNKPLADSVSPDADQAGTVTRDIQALPTAAETTAAETVDAAQQTAPPSEAATPASLSAAEHETWNNRYEIIQKIGGGGQAVVYKAHDHLTNEEIAIKTLLPRHRKDKSAINRLKQEAMVARSLTHRHIIKTYSVEQRTDAVHGGQVVFICMELIASGLELKDLIDKRRAAGRGFALREVLHITGQLLDALKYAHEYTIHRDVKPGNIMLVQHSEEIGTDTSDLTQFDIRLMDFGIAKVLTQKRIEVTGRGFWSAHYGAPELADAKSKVDARADLYSVGVIMYQMLTGSIPRKGSPSANKAHKEVSAELAGVIDKAISTDRDKRFKSAAVFTREIEKAVSRFSWIRKTAKVAAAVLLVLIAAVIVKTLIPATERLLVDENITLLESRNPDQQIADGSDPVITFSDIEGYDTYDALRKEALANLNTLKKAENRTFTSRFPPWKNQEQTWPEVEALIRKAEQIQHNRLEYNNRRDLPVILALTQLEPSSAVLSGVRERTETSDGLFEQRPLSKQTLTACDEAYDSAARVYTNIERLADDSQSFQAAEKLNDMLKDVRQLRSRLLSAQAQLNSMEQLRDEEFQRWSELCLGKADSHYNSFELSKAEQYFSLLNQTCGTFSDVSSQIDFRGSDIGLIVSRLMQLCYEDIETFENYPEWKEKLKAVHQSKELLTQYTLLHQLISKGPENVPESIYTLLDDIRRLQKQGKTEDARDKLETASAEYTKFLNDRINDLERDCGGLLTASSVTDEGVIDIEGVNNIRVALGQLRQALAASSRLEDAHIEEYNRLSVAVSTEKDSVKNDLANKAIGLREHILQKAALAKQADNFWDSKLITTYIYIADQYDIDAVLASIGNWRSVEDVDRLPAPVKAMEDLDSRLDAMLTRKSNLDELARQIDEGAAFCETFKAASEQERQSQQRWLSELRALREQMNEKQDDMPLLDQDQATFDSRYESIYSAAETILNEIPRNSNRVEQTIEQARFLETAGADISRALRQWRSIIPQMKGDDLIFQSASLCGELENIKADVDSWTAQQFNREMLSKCEHLADMLSRQHQAVQTVLGAANELDERLDTMMNDEDILELHSIAARNGKAYVISLLHNCLDQHKELLKEIGSANTSEEIFPADFYSGFNVSAWLEQFNKARQRMQQAIAALQRIQEAMPTDAAGQLAGELSVEQLYLDDLKSAALSAIDEQHEEATGRITSVENDNELMPMCDFLENMGNDTVPTPKTLKQALAAISSDTTNLNALGISNLRTAKEFNRSRKQVSANIASVAGDCDRLNVPELESACKETISNAPSLFKGTIDQAGQTAKVGELAVVLWSFYSEHKDWSEWHSSLRELFHINISEGGQLSFASLSALQPVDRNGSGLLAEAVCLSPADFFYIDTDSAINFGWPRYSNANKDPAVGFVFVPSGPDNPEPFYMAAHETSNAQYRLFLAETGAKAVLRPKGWSRFLDNQDKELVCSTSFDYPPCSIKWDEATNALVVAQEYADVPVTWVTYHGAQSYAGWLSARLPSASQYEYACRAGTADAHPWGNDISQISDYAHVRAAAWQRAADEYNSKINNPLEMAHPPVGAIKDFRADGDKTLDTAKVVHHQSTYDSAWPISNAGKPNTWGLYDMIGNVWEWCENDGVSTQSLICGSSCLSPPEYVRADSRYEFQDRACDVGFRVIVPAR